MSTHLSAAAAAQHLGVSRATLYAYVSRGLIRSRVAHGRRAHEYAREDIERLVAQTLGRRDPLAAAQRVLEFEGLPVLSSSLCLIDGGRLYYRGQDAVELSASASFEEVIALLWDGPCAVPEPLPAPNASVRRALGRLSFAPAGVAHLASVHARERGVNALEPGVVRSVGARILAQLTALAADFRAGRGSIALRLGDALGVSSRRGRRALETALILCADHELNASAFAARVIAAAGATPYMAIIGALGALSGQRHGGMTERVSELFDDPAPASDVIAGRLRRGETIPGFGHPLYPNGDPRGARLLQLCAHARVKTRDQRRAQALAEAAEQSLGLRPNVDFGLVALCRAFGLPSRAPFILFALGRSAGWIGHSIEQYAAGSLIRPRARYVGVSPVDRAHV